MDNRRSPVDHELSAAVQAVIEQARIHQCGLCKAGRPRTDCHSGIPTTYHGYAYNPCTTLPLSLALEKLDALLASAPARDHYDTALISIPLLGRTPASVMEERKSDAEARQLADEVGVTLPPCSPHKPVTIKVLCGGEGPDDSAERVQCAWCNATGVKYIDGSITWRNEK